MPGIHPFHLVAAPLLWCVWFVLAYAGLSVGCALAPPPVEQGALNALNLVLAVAGLCFLAALVAGGRHCLRRAAPPAPDRDRFIGRVAAGLYALSAVGVLAVGLPLLLLPPCL